MHTHKERIQLEDSNMDILLKMAEGNPGALNVCARLLVEGSEIDPQSFAGGLGAILHMDSLGIYGPSIWMLYKDVCKEDLEMTMAILRATQLGLLLRKDLLQVIDNHGEGLDLPDILAKVKGELKCFGVKPKKPEELPAAISPVVGGKYNWTGQVERLSYIGKKGAWHQFEKVEEPGKVWSEVLDEGLHLLEETQPS